MVTLIIEDNKFKSDQLESFLKDQGFNDITIKNSYNSALQELLSGRTFDLILLDISLPGYNDSGGNYMPSGGKHLFSQMFLNDISGKVIVVTLFKKFEDGSEIEQLHEIFKRDYEESYVGYVLFNNNDTKWRSDLFEILKHLTND